MNPGRLILSIVLCQSVGIVAGFLTAQSVKTWYLTLAKPWFTPPGWVFGPAWILLYLLMGIALYLVWQKTGSLSTPAAVVFMLQLALNGAWSLIFFGLRSPFWGFVEIALLLAAIIGTILLFWRITPTAGALLVPYLLWVSFASILNYSIWQLNR